MVGRGGCWRRGMGRMPRVCGVGVVCYGVGINYEDSVVKY